MIRVIKKINRLFEKKQKVQLVFLLFLMLVGAFLEVMSVGLMIPFASALMDEEIILSNSTISSIWVLFKIGNMEEFILLILLSLILVFVIKDIYLIFEEKLQLEFVYNNRFKTQQKVLDAYLRKPYEFFLTSNTGEIVRAVCDDVNYAYLILTSMLTMLTNLVMGIALLITIFLINPMITIAVLISTIASVMIISLTIKPILNREGENRRIASARANMWLFQSVQGIKEIKVSLSSDFFKESYNKSGLDLIKCDKKNLLWGNVSKRVIEITTVSSVLIVIAISIVNGMELKDIVPALSAFAMAAIRLLPSANAVISTANAIAYQEKSLDVLLDNLQEIENDSNILNINREINNDLSEVTINESIQLENITYSYPGSTKHVLEDANIFIPVGSSIGIVGESGAGKTTAIDVLLGLLSPDKGNVLSDGEIIKDNYPIWLKKVGYIPQTIFLIDDTIEANVMFGKKVEGDNESRVIEALRKAQLLDYVSSLPEGVKTKIGERGIRLSGGQRQRIGIARVLFTDPSVLVFDEATSSLDTETEEAIMESVNRLKGEKTMIIIAHRVTTLKECDLVFKVENGKISKISKEELGI